MALILLGGFLIVYFVPSIVASNRDKKDQAAIVVVNIFLGWTLIGWVIALAWACMEDKPESPAISAIEPDTVSKLKELEIMFKSGTITEQEFITLKSKLISGAQ